MKLKKKRYLGDSVYAEINEYGLKLTTENDPDEPTKEIYNEIYLESEVWNALDEYMKDSE